MQRTSRGSLQAALTSQGWQGIALQKASLRLVAEPVQVQDPGSPRKEKEKVWALSPAGKDLGQVICVALQAEETRTSLLLRGSGGAGSGRHSVPPKTDAETMIKIKSQLKSCHCQVHSQK